MQNYKFYKNYKNATRRLSIPLRACA